MRKANVRIGERYIYDGCTHPGSIVTTVSAPRFQAPAGWVVDGTSENTDGAIGAYPTRDLQPVESGKPVHFFSKTPPDSCIRRPY